MLRVFWNEGVFTRRYSEESSAEIRAYAEQDDYGNAVGQEFSDDCFIDEEEPNGRNYNYSRGDSKFLANHSRSPPKSIYSNHMCCLVE